jgi:tetratricopeptide (TPR) repeat protein
MAAVNLAEPESSIDSDLARAAQALKARDLRTAEAIVRTVLKAHPNHVVAIQLLGEIAAAAGLLHEAEPLHRRALALAPDFEHARLHLANVLNDQGRPGEALAELKKIAGEIREFEGFRRLYADALSQVGESDDAIDIYCEIVASDPTDLGALSRLVFLLQTVGKGEEAVDACRSALKHSPASGRAWATLATLKSYRFTAEDIETLERALAAPCIGTQDRAQLHFALGKALEDRGDFQASFDQYRRGNDLRRSQSRYSPNWGAALFERTRAVFTNKFLESRADEGDPASDPIFIVGMPRSGSTLVEQILASHPLIEGTGELPDIHALAISLDPDPRLGPRNIRYLDRLSALSGAQLRELGGLYLERTRVQRKTERPFFIDKMPSNWAHVGFIKLILPNAKIVDVRRHPLACGFSNYKQLFGRGQEFSYDLAYIGTYYRDYTAVMAHFDAVAPGMIHRLIYEQLVADPEEQMRRLLDYLGLPFDQACLRFHETERAVRTPSSEQVRQPLRPDFANHWKAFQAELGPLKDALGPALDHWDDPQAR